LSLTKELFLLAIKIFLLKQRWKHAILWQIFKVQAFQHTCILVEEPGNLFCGKCLVIKIQTFHILHTKWAKMLGKTKWRNICQQSPQNVNVGKPDVHSITCKELKLWARLWNAFSFTVVWKMYIRKAFFSVLLTLGSKWFEPRSICTCS